MHGRLCMLIHDGKIPVEMNFLHNGFDFNIKQIESDGSIFIENITIRVKGKYGFFFHTPLNHRGNYPLKCEYIDECYSVFDESGEFDEDFLQFIKEIS